MKLNAGSETQGSASIVVIMNDGLVLEVSELYVQLHASRYVMAL